MSRLPSGYTQLEYIQSSGAQYINTGFKPTGATKVDITFQMLSQGSAQQSIFGARPGTSGRFTVFTGYSTGDLQVDYNTAQSLASLNTEISGLNVNSKTTLSASNVLVVNGASIKTVSVVTFTSAYALFLFANNNAGAVQLPGAMRLYECQVYDNGTLARSFVPCKAPSGAIGLYDTVGAAFYANAGSGAFTAGPEIIPDPPAAPTDLQTALAIALLWTAVDGADHYNVYRDGTKLGSTTATRYIDLTVEENQTYTYSVTAENSGGESAAASLTVYTKTGYFQYKPVIESANFL